jgi:hypothetical protein
LEFGRSTIRTFGAWPKDEGETAEAYSERIKRATFGGTKGLALHLDDDQFPEHTEKELAEMFLPGQRPERQ